MARADEISLKEREQASREQATEAAFRKAATGELNKAIGSTVRVAGDVIEQARKAGAAPDKIRGLVAPLLGDIDALSKRAGRDPGPILNQVNAMIGVPAAPEGEASPTTEIGKLRSDLKNGFITQAEFGARVNNLTRDMSEPNVIEGIRRKLATGEALSEGEAKVYDDALKADPIARLLAGAMSGAPAVPVSPARPAAPQSFATPAEVEAAIKAGKVKIGDTVTIGGKPMKVAP